MAHEPPTWAFHLLSLSSECVGVYTFLTSVAGSVWQVNEPNYTISQVEIRKVDDDASEAVEDKAPIRREVNGDVEGANSGGGVFGGADLDPADQTLVGDLSQDADASVVKEVAVSGFPMLDSSSYLPLSTSVRRVAFFYSSVSLFASACLWRSSGSVCSFRSFIYPRVIGRSPQCLRCREEDRG